MRKLLVLLAVFVLIAGCVGQSASAPPTQTGTSESTTPKESSSASIAVISAVSSPTNVVENSRFLVSWKVATLQPSVITKTVLYYDKLSHAGEAGTAMQPEVLKYASVTPTHKGNTPSEFTDYVASGSAAGDVPNKVYFRAYALINGQNYWSDEYAVIVAPKPAITLTDVPSSVGKSSTFNVKWSLKNGYPGKIDSTYVLWGTRSGQYNQHSSEQVGAVPASFAATLTAPSTAPETLYLIVTYAVDGVSYNSTEKAVTVY